MSDAPTSGQPVSDAVEKNGLALIAPRFSAQEWHAEIDHIVPTRGYDRLPVDRANPQLHCKDNSPLALTLTQV